MIKISLSLKNTLLNDTIIAFLSVCGLSSHLKPENSSLVWRRHHIQWRAANFNKYSALMAIEQWGFFNVPHLLRHGPTVYNVHHLQGYSHLLPSVGTVTTCFNDLGLSRPGIEPRSPACKANALPLYRSFLVEVSSLQIKSSNTNIHKGYANDICKSNLMNWFFSDLVVWCKLGYFS